MLGNTAHLLAAPDAIQSVPEFVHRVLGEMILNGELRSGEKIQQERIATLLGVSRVPVREALKLLEAEGLVEFRPRRGYIVASLDPGEVREVFEIRMLLEERAVHLGTQKRTSDDVAAVEQAMRAMEEIRGTSPAEIQELAKLNLEFHRRLAEPCGQPLLLQLVTLLRHKVEPYIRVDAVLAGAIASVHREHRAIFRAFRDRDADKIAALTRAHIGHVSDRLVSFLEGERQKGPGKRGAGKAAAGKAEAEKRPARSR